MEGPYIIKQVHQNGMGAPRESQIRLCFTYYMSYLGKTGHGDINSNTSNECKATNKAKAPLTDDCGVHKKTSSDIPVELCDCLSLLPKEIQQLFFERLVETITDPETFKKHMDMISAMAAEVTAEALAISSSSKQQQSLQPAS
eukprot:13983346-Ditylum_brightwellii.AAC.1